MADFDLNKLKAADEDLTRYNEPLGEGVFIVKFSPARLEKFEGKDGTSYVKYTMVDILNQGEASQILNTQSEKLYTILAIWKRFFMAIAEQSKNSSDLIKIVNDNFTSMAGINAIMDAMKDEEFHIERKINESGYFNNTVITEEKALELVEKFAEKETATTEKEKAKTDFFADMEK